MIDERLQELAALQALDLLEGAELAQFEASLANNPELQQLVAELRHASTSLAHQAAMPAPAALRQRVLASVEKAGTAPDNVIRPPASIFSRLAPWAAAACFALIAAWLGQRYFTVQNESLGLRQQQELAALELKAVRQQLEAERIVNGRQLQSLDTQLADTNRQLTTLQSLAVDRSAQLDDRDRLLAEARKQLAERERQLAEAQTRLGERERQLATLNQRVDALAGASAEIGRQLGEAKNQVAQLNTTLKSQSDLAQLKITTLASMLKNSPQALAVAVWDPARQEGVLTVDKLPALLANQDYQLWVVDPQYPNPVDGGVFTVDPQTGMASVTFKARQPVKAINAFAVTRERKGGVPKAEGPFVLLGK
jgi:DNA repair exonuclease SbcCD ATPase subunit